MGIAGNRQDSQGFMILNVNEEVGWSVPYSEGGEVFIEITNRQILSPPFSGRTRGGGIGRKGRKPADPL
jgi:hypothetical protein